MTRGSPQRRCTTARRCRRSETAFSNRHPRAAGIFSQTPCLRIHGGLPRNGDARGLMTVKRGLFQQSLAWPASRIRPARVRRPAATASISELLTNPAGCAVRMRRVRKPGPQDRPRSVPVWRPVPGESSGVGCSKAKAVASSWRAAAEIGVRGPASTDRGRSGEAVALTLRPVTSSPTERAASINVGAASRTLACHVGESTTNTSRPSRTLARRACAATPDGR